MVLRVVRRLGLSTEPGRAFAALALAQTDVAQTDVAPRPLSPPGLVVPRMIVGFAGAAGSGKDTAADLLVAHGFHKYSFATPLKRACRELFGLTESQTHGAGKDVVDPRYGVTPRRLFQMLGTDFVRDRVSPTAFVDRFEGWCDAAAPGRVVVADVRFQNEVDAIRARGGKTYLIDRGGPASSAASEPVHVSERPWGLDVDGVIRNHGGVDDLHRAVLAVLPALPRPRAEHARLRSVFGP